MRIKLSSVLSCAAAAIYGCGGSGMGLDSDGRPISGETTALVPKLQSIQDNVFTPICTTCHVGAAAPLGLRLDADSAYAMLVNASSVEAPGLRRVSPGDPDASYLIQKLEGRAAVGGQMPLGQTPLPQATIDVIRQWIADGAQQQLAVSAKNAALQMHAVMPFEGEVLAQAPRELLIQASGAMDVASLGAANLSLRGSGGDGSFADGNEIPIHELHVVIHSVDPTVLALSVPQGSWAPDTYELTLTGSGAAPVLDSNGAAIDGAGAGSAGSDFTLRFTIGTSM